MIIYTILAYIIRKKFQYTPYKVAITKEELGRYGGHDILDE